MSFSSKEPGEQLVPFHCLSLLVTGLSLHWLELTTADPSPVSRVPQVLGFVASSQVVALLLTYFLIKRKPWICKEKDTKRRKNSANLEMKRPPMLPTLARDIRDGFLSIMATLIAFHAVIIFLGAPILEFFDRTFSLSCLLTVLTVVPLLLLKPSHYGAGKQMQPLNESQPEKASSGINLLLDRLLLRSPFLWEGSVENFLVTNAYVVSAGAWFGVFPIKLDWMRPWQEFPVTCFVGALLANSLGHVVALLAILFKHLFRKR
jgi:hypothetical protein